jgi:stringent starvation protein B
MAIYARENGQGMAFPASPVPDKKPRAVTPVAPATEDAPPEPPTTPPGGKRPVLTRIK